MEKAAIHIAARVRMVPDTMLAKWGEEIERKLGRLARGECVDTDGHDPEVYGRAGLRLQAILDEERLRRNAL